MTATRLFARALVRVSPLDESEDAAEFLQGLVTSDVKGLLPVWTGLLTPQGKVLFDFLVWPSGKALLLDCEADAADALVKRLSIYRLRRKIAIARDDRLAVHWRPHEGDGAAPDPRLHALGERWIAPVDDTDVSADEEWRAHRLALGVVFQACDQRVGMLEKRLYFLQQRLAALDHELSSRPGGQSAGEAWRDAAA